MYNLQSNSGMMNYQHQPDPRIWDYQQKVNVDIYKEAQLSDIRINEAYAKEQIIGQMRTEEYARKLSLREEAQEQKRALIQALEVDEVGNVLVRTRNTKIESQPRKFTNMRHPSIFILRSLNNPMENPIYLLSCLVGEEQKQIFLSCDRLARGDYLVAKLTAAGIYFMIKSSSKIKPLLLQLVGELAENCAGKKSLPETAGWTKLNDHYYFISEEEMTWSTIKSLAN